MIASPWSDPYVIAVDWSAASSPGPKKPTANRIWMSAGDETTRNEPTYHRTRADAIQAIIKRVPQDRATIIALDFPLGYPVLIDGEMSIPGGRLLCEIWGRMLEDDDNDSNNRFVAADSWNESMREEFGVAPYWGRPASYKFLDLPAKRPVAPWSVVNEYRACERVAKGLGWSPQSCWKLAYAGSVGSQLITGCAALNKLIDHPVIGPRLRFWPFEQMDDLLHPVVLAEAYPTLTEAGCTRHTIKDANQVEALRDALLRPDAIERALAIPLDDMELARVEGWILGLHSFSPELPHRSRKATW